MDPPSQRAFTRSRMFFNFEALHTRARKSLRFTCRPSTTSSIYCLPGSGQFHELICFQIVLSEHVSRSLANFTIFMMVLTSSLEDPSFNIKGVSWGNTIIQNTYLGTVVACFVLSMGNRPKAARWKYLSVMALLAITTVYMMAAAIFCVVKAIQRWDNSLLFTQIVISLLSTYGCYVLAR